MTDGTDTPGTETPDSGPRTIVVDLGKRKRKQVKRLTRGDGPLMAEIQATVADLRSGGHAGANDSVVVVVEKKPGRAPRLKW